MSPLLRHVEAIMEALDQLQGCRHDEVATLVARAKRHADRAHDAATALDERALETTGEQPARAVPLTRR